MIRKADIARIVSNLAAEDLFPRIRFAPRFRSSAASLTTLVNLEPAALVERRCQPLPPTMLFCPYRLQNEKP
jgi:hypothetical protein